MCWIGWPTQGVERAVVNVHYLADLIENHLASRKAPPDRHLRRAGEAPQHRRRRGQSAAASSATEPFFHINSDTHLDRRACGPLSSGSPRGSIRRPWTRCCCWRPPTTASAMRAAAISRWRPTGWLKKRSEREMAPFVYAGAALLRPELFKDAPERRVLPDAAVRPRRRSRAACTGCDSKASGCVSARPARSPRPRPRSWPARPGRNLLKGSAFHLNRSPHRPTGRPLAHSPLRGRREGAQDSGFSTAPST